MKNITKTLREKLPIKIIKKKLNFSTNKKIQIEILHLAL